MDSNNFKQAFKLEANNYKNIISLIGYSLGFSCTREYDKALVNQIGVKDNKEYKLLAQVWIDETKLISPLGKLPINLHFSFVLYEATNPDNLRYIITDRYIKNKNKKPIDVVSFEEYFLSLEEQKCYKKNQNQFEEISAEKIMDEVFKQHIREIGFINNTVFNLQYFFYRKFLASIFGLLTFITTFSINLIEDIVSIKVKIALNNTSPNEEYPNNADISFLGFKTDPVTIIGYALIHFIIFFIAYFYNFKPHILRLITENNFLLPIYVILSLTLFSILLKAFINLLLFLRKRLKYIINYFTNKKFKYLLKPITIKNV